MCSGRVDLDFVLRAFSNGMDGVFLGGCRLNECNYITQGNYDALNMTNLFKKLLEQVGLNPERLRIEFMSSAEGAIFVEVVDDFVKKLKELGPLGIGEGKSPEQLKLDLETMESYVRKKLVSYYIEPEKCQACMICFRECPVKAITGGRNQIHVIDQEKCIACGICLQVCPPRFSAIKKILAEPTPPPIPEGARTITRGAKVS